MKKDIVLLIAGALIGFAISIITIKYQEYRERKRASKICKTELLKISKLIIPLIEENNHLELPNGKLKPFVGISTTEIPNFKMTNQLDIFLSLEDTLRSSVYNISFDLDCAENYRKLSIPLLSHPDKIKELDMYGNIYLEYLKSAKTKIATLEKEIK